MQAQQTRNTSQVVNQTQSLAAVQTLLRASLGAITFLRDLLPEDNFTQSHFTTIDEYNTPEVGLSQPDESQESTPSRRHVNSFRIMTITRGYTDEADKILNYLEYGIFNALEKRYLRSFIFAIYLDNKEPNNIVEAYTFNFKYHTIPGSDTSIPVMSLEGKNISSNQNTANADDPVTKAIRKGKAPTLKDVKMSVKAMLKALIQAMNHMDILPRRRFATFKVFYTDETPVDYEPPNFQAGDIDKDKWFFRTHDLDEIPERCSVGRVDTGHHFVKLSVTSIASYLPSSTEHDDSTFAGTTTIPGRLPMTPIQVATNCKNQAKKQLEDADHRNLVWPVDDSAELYDEDPDAEADEDDEYVKISDGTYVKADSILPLGFRNKSGAIEALPTDEQVTVAHFGGQVEYVPQYLHEIVAKKIPVNYNIEETQPLLLAPENNSRPLSSPLSAEQSAFFPTSTPATTPTPDFDPEMMKNMNLGAPNDVEMLDPETHMSPSSVLESIKSFTQNAGNASNVADVNDDDIQDNGLDCECGISLEDVSCYCEGGCKKWFHVWCMGYHSEVDRRMPSKFVCFDCRVRSDITWDLIKIDLYPRMLSKLKELALFRRAIKVAHDEKRFTSFQFSKAFGGDVALGGQMLKRLEDEEFVLHESIVLDDMGLIVKSHAKKEKGNTGKGRAKQVKPRKNMQRTRYVFNTGILVKTQYLDYFKPDDQEMESRLLGVPEMTKEVRPPKHLITLLESSQTQTQEETQVEGVLPETHKRASPQDELYTLEHARAKKRVKVSLAIGVDLAE